MQHIYKNQQGFGIIEIIIAMALFIIVAVTGITTVLGSFTTNRLGDEETEATLIAQQGIESVRSIKNQGWATPFLGTSCSSGCGVNTTTGSRAWSGLNNVIGEFTRVITVSPVQRNGSGVIVASGGTDDPDTKKVTSTVTWNFTSTRNNTVALSTYLTNFVKAIAASWSNPTQQAALDLSGNSDGLKVQTVGNYAYVIRTGETNFSIIDIANPATPTLAGSLTLDNNLSNIFVSGNYAYVTSSANAAELMVVNVSNPASPSLVGTYNDAGNDDATGIFVVGTTAYLSMNGGNDLQIVNVSNPASPTAVGGVVLSGGATEVSVSGNYAYVSSTDNSQELMVVNVTVPTAPVLSGSLNLPGNNDALTVANNGTTVFVGQGSSLTTVNAANPLAPSQSGTLSASGAVNDIALAFANTNTTIFMAVSNNSLEFQVVNVANLAAPILQGSLNITGNNELSGLAYNEALDRVIAVSNATAQEVLILQP